MEIGSNLMSDFHFFFFSSRGRHTRLDCDWSSDVCSSDLAARICRRLIARREGRHRRGADPGLRLRAEQHRSADRVVRDGKRAARPALALAIRVGQADRKSTRLNSSHSQISYAVFCVTKKNNTSCMAEELVPGGSVKLTNTLGSLGDNICV